MRILLYALLTLTATLIILSYLPSDIPQETEVRGFSLPPPPDSVQHPLAPAIWALLGAVVILVVSWFKFNDWTVQEDASTDLQPSPGRHLTTWMRFAAWYLGYAVVLLGVFALVAFFPEVAYKLATAMQGFLTGPEREQVGEWAELVASGDIRTDAERQVATALAVVLAAWAGVPGLARLERWLRCELQKQALIPAEAEGMVDMFSSGDGEFVPDHGIAEEVAGGLDDKLLPAADIVDEHAPRLTALYARVAYLHHQLERQANKPLFKKVIGRYKGDRADLGNDLKALRGAFAARLSELADYRQGADTVREAEEWLSKHIAKAPKWEKRQLQREVDLLQAQLESVLTHLYRVIVCSVLARGRSETHRRELMGRFGLALPGRVGIHLDRATLVSAAFFVVTSVGLLSVAYSWFMTSGWSTVAAAGGDLVPRGPMVVVWAVMGCLMHLIAIFGGYLMQRGPNIRAMRESDGGTRAVDFRAWLSDVLEAGLMGFCLNALLFWALAQIPGAQALGHNWLWAAIPAVTAAFVAHWMHYGVSRRRPEVKRAIAQGAATGFAGLVVVALVLERQIFSAGEGGDVARYFLLYTVVTSILVGAAISFVLQDWVGSQAGAERTKRKRARRINRRMEGTWQSEEIDCPVKTRNVSESGVALRRRLPVAENTEGTLALGSVERPVRVVRHADGWWGEYTCLQYLKPTGTG